MHHKPRPLIAKAPSINDKLISLQESFSTISSISSDTSNTLLHSIFVNSNFQHEVLRTNCFFFAGHSCFSSPTRDRRGSVHSLCARSRQAQTDRSLGDPLPQTSRITAFVVDHDGNPSVECWEITNIVDDLQVQRKDGSTATSRAMSLAKAGELDGLDILTWPAASPIWPIPGHDVAQTNFDLAASFKYDIVLSSVTELIQYRC